MRSLHRPGKNQSSGPPLSSSAVRKGVVWEGVPWARAGPSQPAAAQCCSPAIVEAAAGSGGRKAVP